MNNNTVLCELCGKEIEPGEARACHLGLLCSACFGVLGLDGEEYLSRKQAAELLGVSEPTMSRMILRGDVPAYRVGLKWRIPRANLLKNISSS